MEKVKEENSTRASNILSSMNEFGGLSHTEMVDKVVDLVNNAKTHRDLRIPAAVLNKYCQRNKCSVDNLELLLNQIGWQLMYKYNWQRNEAQSMLDDLVEKIVALGRLKYGKIS